MAWPSTQTFWVAPKRDILVAFSVFGIAGLASSLQNYGVQNQCSLKYICSNLWLLLLSINFPYSLFLSFHRCWGSASRPWRLDSIWDQKHLLKVYLEAVWIRGRKREVSGSSFFGIALQWRQSACLQHFTQFCKSDSPLVSVTCSATKFCETSSVSYRNNRVEFCLW